MDQLMMGDQPQPQPQRRPRVREVSSRFMTPPVSASSSSGGDLSHSFPTRSPLPKHHATPSVAERRRHLDMEPLRCSSSDENRPKLPESPLPLPLPPPPPDQNQKRTGASTIENVVNLKPLRERKGGSNGFSTPLRPDTPMMVTASLDRTCSSRYRLIQQQKRTPAAKLLQCSSMSPTTTADVRSSMSEANKICNRAVNRSLNLPLSNSALPPVPPCAAPDIRKAKKVSSLREDAHSLRLLENRYLQWRCANAKAQASLLAQQRENETRLYSLAMKIPELCDSVKQKRIKLDNLQRTKTLSTILEAQIPYLEQWCALEEDYSISLEEVIRALLNASLRLPISASVRFNKQEMEQALHSAIELMEIIVLHVQQSMPKAEETEHLITELARVIGGERALIEECGNLLSKTYITQVEECTLRGHIIQLKQSCCP